MIRHSLAPALTGLCLALASLMLFSPSRWAHAQQADEAAPAPKKAAKQLPGKLGALGKGGNKGDQAAAIAGQVAAKVAARAATMVGGVTAGAIVGGLGLILGFIGDAVQRDKCKLGCCPPKNLKGSWACKYQTKATCNNHYSDYPGHGDHACWWNQARNRCEVGITCRDKTFNFFALVGSLCPPCPNEPVSEPQWSKSALKKGDLPARFYVDPAKEYLWCAPKGAPGRCSTVKQKKSCEESYADHRGDKNCVWKANKCTEGAKCDNGRERLAAAKRLGLKYFGGAWRRNGAPISYTSDYKPSAPSASKSQSPAKASQKGKARPAGKTKAKAKRNAE